MSLFKHDRTFKEPMNWTVTSIMAAFHVGAIAALFLFSWKGLVLTAFLWWVTGSLGVGMCYHRLLTHRGYKTYRWLEYLLTLCGTLALEGGPIAWVATHRIHHQNADKQGDPHSPQDGGFWSHMGWILTGKAIHHNTKELFPYVPDLRKDRFQVWISKWHWLPIAALGLIFLAAGGWSWLLWGIFFRTTVGLHATWLVNSATHIWGSQRFLTGDTSTNSFWVALLTWGEGWHNNHHAFPQVARHGYTWYEVDCTWYALCVLQFLGLIWDVKLPKAKTLDPAQNWANKPHPSVLTPPLLETKPARPIISGD